MPFNRFTTQIPGSISSANLTSGLRDAIAKAGLTPISEFTGVRPTATGTNANHLIYSTPASNVSLILSIRTTQLFIEQILGLNWDVATNRASNYTRDVLAETLGSTSQVTIDVLRNPSSLLVSVRQGTYTGLYGYVIGEKPEWWDATKFPHTFQFSARNSEALIGFDGTLNPYGQNANYNSSESLGTITPAGVRDVVPGFFILPNTGGSIAGRVNPDIAKVCANGTVSGDTLIKGTEEYLILTQGASSGIAARLT